MSAYAAERTGSAGRASAAVVERHVWSIRRAAICLVMLAFCFAQAPGEVVPDTKLDLTQSPLGFLGRALEMWDPAGFGGQVQNQAYGYLFPIGPYFAAGEALGLPGWVVQRLWWGVVLSVAFLGITTLARRLRIGSPTTQIVAGLAFALSPRLISTLGPVSAEAWPMALAPWVVVPLVVACRGGSIRRPAMLSAVAVALMGGVNAALCLAAVLPAVLYLLTRRPGPRWWRLAGWWSASVAAATVWWVVPLLLLGRYSPPFLDYIETADVTTSTTSAAQALRGTSHWVAYLGPQLGSQWQAGYDLVSVPVLELDGLLVVAIGLFGLALRGMRERGWLVAMLLLGVVAVTFGHTGPGSAWFAGDANDLLDGLLAPLRNVHKFDPLIRIPIVLGIAHAALVAPRWVRRLDAGRFAAGGVLGVIVVVVAAGAAPAVTGRVAPAGAFTELPGYWREAAGWLDERAEGRTLVLPGSRFAVYGWGRPMDEPLQTLTDAPWEVRNAIPLVPPGHIRMLDAVERRLATGTPSPGLAEYLARAGVGQVLVRNDLDPDTSGAPLPVLVHEVLDGSPGLTRVATFGPEISQPDSPGLYVDDGLRTAAYPAVEIYQVTGVTETVTLAPLADSTEVYGGPESLLDLADNGLLPAAGTVLAAQAPADLSLPRVALTDGLRRREVDFGRSLDNASAVLTAEQPLRLDRPESDYRLAPDPRLQAVARWQGVADVEVSSSLADVDTPGGPDPSRGPAAAFDGSLDTAWLAVAPDGDAATMTVRLDAPVAVDDVVAVLPAVPTDVTSIRVTTATDSVQEQVVAGVSRIGIDLSGEPVDEVRIELVGTGRGPDLLGLAEVQIGEVSARQVLVPPTLALDDPAQRGAVSFAAGAGHADQCAIDRFAYCSPLLGRTGEEDAGLFRTLELAEGRAFALSGAVAPVPGRWLDQLLLRNRSDLTMVTASSSAVDDPLGGPVAVVDADARTGWVAGALDQDPTLTLTWRSPQTIDEVRFTTSARLAASRPDAVTLDTDDGTRVVTEVDEDGVVTLRRPLTTRRLTIGFSSVTPAYSVDPVDGSTVQLPVGVSDVDLPGTATAIGALIDAGRSVTVDCGDGPAMDVGGEVLPVRVMATVGQLARLDSVAAVPCAGTTVDLGAGSYEIRWPSTDHWRPTRWAAAQDGWRQQPAAGPTMTVEEWSRSERTVAVGARTEPALLAVRENANPGWVARLDGERLDTVEVDGWMQGYVVPTGAGGEVVLTFEPARTYRVAVIGGLVLLVVLLLAAAVPGRTSPTPALAALRAPLWLRGAAALLAAVVIAGLPGLVTAVAALGLAALLRRGSFTSGGLGLTIAATTALLTVVAGALATWDPGGADSSTSAWAVQLCCVAALALVTVVPIRRRQVPPPQQAVDASA